MRPSSTTIQLLALAGALSLSACATVHQHYVRPDYEQADKTQTVRLAVVTAPLPAHEEAVGKLWSDLARTWVNDHRDFIAKVQRTADVMPPDACGEGIEGVLALVPTRFEKKGSGVEASLQAKLTRCRDGQVVWTADAGSSWKSNDDSLTEVTNHYVELYGEAVRPYVAPSYHLLHDTLETLPKPKLPDDNAVMEKIELAE